ncbi:MAG: zinc ribbon domain-containing protein [Vicinamibacteria bacterium]|nr:zinc ribbon domain-containing protein [Vicinamibacteria bacterium]
MVEVTASAKYACPACGAQATWDPGKHALICGFCGTESAAELKTAGEIVEHDLQQTLASLQGRETGLAREAIEVKCQSCQAISSFEPNRVAQNCDFCGSAALVPYQDVKELIRPESLLPMKVSESRVREDVRRWYGSRWFAPNALGQKAMTDTLRGLYVPYWTFDAQVHASWTAESGTYYYTTETYTENGQRRTRQVRHTRWSPASGQLDHFFDDELVCGSKGVHPTLLRQVEPFPTKEAVPYDSGYLAGFVVERYQVDLASAAQVWRTEMHAKTEALCAEQIPGDTYRNLQTQQQYSAQTFKHVLVPVWLLSYVYRAKPYQVVVNGYTGKIAGEHPLSWVKILFAAAAVIIVAIIVISISSSN